MTSALSRVDDAGEGIDRFAVDEHVELDHVGNLVAVMLVIHRAIPARDAFDAVMEIDQNFVQRSARGQHDAARIQRFGVIHDPALLRDQRHHVADVFIRSNDERFDHRLLNFLDVIHLRHERGIIDFLHRAVGHGDPIDDARIRRDDVHLVLAAQTFLDDFQVQQSQEIRSENRNRARPNFRSE